MALAKAALLSSYMQMRTTGLPASLPFVAALVTLFLAGCATTTARAPEPEAAIPGAGYHMLMAEIAAQRGLQPTAVEEYLNAAERSDNPDESQRAAEFAFRYGFDSHALRAARRWAALAPADSGARLYLVRLLVRRNDVEGAARQAEAALGPAAQRSDADYQQLAGELGEETNLEGVTRVWSRLAAGAPALPALQTALAAAALRSRDYDLALASARAAIDPDIAWPTDAEAQALIGRALLAHGDTEAALGQAREQIAVQPGVESELEYASLLATAERNDEALAVLTALEANFGDQPAIRRLHGLVSLAAEDYRSAWEQFSGLVSNDDYGDESYFHLAEIALHQEQLETTIQMLARVSGGPYLLAARDTLARIAVARGDVPSALQVLDSLAAQHPELAFQAARRRAAILQKQGELQQARTVLDDILRYQPDDADLRLARGTLLEQMGEVQPALADMEAAVALFPDNAMALNAYGYTLLNHGGRVASARPLIRRALERQPEDPAILDSYGWLLYRQGRMDEARSYLALAWSRLADPEVAAHLGEVLWKQGERDAARRLWDEALQAAPDSRPLRDTMQRFLD